MVMAELVVVVVGVFVHLKAHVMHNWAVVANQAAAAACALVEGAATREPH